MIILLVLPIEKSKVNVRNNFLMALLKWKDLLIKSVKRMKKKTQMEDVEVPVLVFALLDALVLVKFLVQEIV